MKRSLMYTVILTFVLASNAQAGSQSCSNLQGEWKNQLGSTLSISSIDGKTGKLTGTYVSPSGTAGDKHELSGWVNNEKNPEAKSFTPAISFSVQWGKYGSITSWTGSCDDKGGVPTITTIWNLVRTSSQFTWDHVLTNSDVFTPKQ
ncbi:MAG: avidin/streptavidin family protein [Nitrospira sp.]|nr:avidin/streptavidin family protein [Nitrospira sp.]